jgi:hypothetical protein
VGGARCLGRTEPPQFDPLRIETLEEPDAAAEEYRDQVTTWENIEAICADVAQLVEQRFRNFPRSIPERSHKSLKIQAEDGRQAPQQSPETPVHAI